MAEKRNYVRFLAEGDVELKPEGASDQDIVQGRLADIGFVGFCVFTDQKIEVGTPLDFKIYIHTMREYFTGRGRIVVVREIKKFRKTSFRTAVVFIDTEKDRILSILTKIQDYINREKRKRWQSEDNSIGLF
jgi:hypothetical protein